MPCGVVYGCLPNALFRSFISMAPRQRDPPPPGILASAFSFVSREIESFVTAATGGDVEGKIQPRPHASTSRVTLDLGVPSTDNSHECEKDVKKKHVQDGTGREAVRSRKRRPVHSDNESESSSRVMRRKSPCHADFSFVSIGDDLQHKESSLQASTSRTTLDEELSKRDDRGGPDRRKRARKISDSDPLQKCKPRARTNESDADDETDSPSARSPSSKSSRVGDNVTIHKASPAPSRSPSPVPLPLNIPRSTMPGSLFPRSPSLMPDTPSPGYIARRVRFIPPSSLSASVEEPTEEPVAGPSGPVTPQKSSRRDQGDHGMVKDAAKKFAPDADPSLMLPSSPAILSPRRMEKQPEQQASQLPLKTRRKERIWDTSGEIRVRGKESELRAVREAQVRNESEPDDTERGHDKERIRVLEEEIARLKAELAVRNSHLMPPPPPPPPPSALSRPSSTSQRSASSSSSSSVAFPSIIDPKQSARTSSFLISARAGLKPTARPMEAPINAGPYALRKAGHPTVNVPTDKMAAFLNEVKTARLRKVSDGASASNLGRSISDSGMSTARRAATVGDLSFDIGIAARLGEKRKRDLNVADDTTGAPSAKRRYTTFTIPDNTSTNSSSSNASNETRSTAPGLSSSPPNSQLMHPSSQTWPSVSSTETDITTPSLCSDNDNEHERELPSPPTPDQHGSPAHADTTLTRLTPPQPEREVIDVDQDSPESHIVHPIEQPLPILERKDVQSAFARRVPSSPMPPDTPRKPLPPARSRPRTKPTRKPIPVEDEDASDGVDPLSLTYSPPSMKVVRAAPRIADPPLQPRIKKGTNKDSSRLPVPARASRVPDAPPITPTISQQQQQQQHQHQEAPTTSNTIRRRRTLDEELRRAGDSLWQDTPVAPLRDNQQHADVQEDLDSGELVGVGTKSKRRGFLSGGGAAGAPVFMGVGYVQGAMDDDEIQIIEPPQKKTSKTKTKR